MQRLAFDKLSRRYLLHFLSCLWPIFSTEEMNDVDAENLPNLQQMYTGGEDVFVLGWSFVGWKYWPCREKSSKYRCWTRPPSWWKWCYKVSNIVLQISVYNFLAANICLIQKCSTRPFFPFRVDWEVYILSTTNLKWGENYWNIWLWTKRERNFTEIFGRG